MGDCRIPTILVSATVLAPRLLRRFGLRTLNGGGLAITTVGYILPAGHRPGRAGLARRQPRRRPRAGRVDPRTAAAHGYALSFAVAAGLTAVGALLGFLGITRPKPAKPAKPAEPEPGARPLGRAELLVR
jgi:hypothetical protein